MRSFFFMLITTVTFGANAQSTTHTIMHNGVERYYRLYVPEDYSGDDPVPLVFNLHGYGSQAFQQELYGDFRPIADTANFILVHPEGLNDLGGNQFWNAFGVPGIDDVGFISALIDTLSAEYSIDEQCVYSTGMSNGGFMSFELACMLSNRIAAVASVTGTMAENRLAVCNPEFARPMMQIHGTQDATVPYNGNAEFASIPDVVDFWVETNNCNPTPVITDIPNIDPGDGTTTEHYLYEGGANGNTVEHYKVTNGGHTWPGAFIAIGATSNDFNASVEIWRFFRQHKLGGTTSVADHPDNRNFSLYPNPSTGVVNIAFDETIDHIRLVDLTGRMVEEWAGSGSNIQINVTQKGIYVMQVQIGNQVMNQKLLLQ
jgi:polyhydroxybutyrate depolymerase